MLLSYKTIQNDGFAELNIKKSRFICFAQRINSEEEAKQFIHKIKKEHWKANHHCSAFVLGEYNEIQRSSDDGEPSGTAGGPMLEVLKKNELLNIAVVVTRYFGGVKLGAGGLIRAYSNSVSHALNEIGIVLCTLQQELSVSIDYPQLGKVEHFLEQKKLPITAASYTDKVTVTILIDETAIENIQTELINLLSNQVTFTKGPKKYSERLIQKEVN